MVPRESYQLALSQAENWKMLLFAVTPALGTVIVVLFLRLQAFGERALTGLAANTEALKDIREDMNRAK